MSERVEAVVIGAGVVGLACARALARAGKEVLILERHGAIGSEISARNSEVIHAGIYYPQASLKAQLCVQGCRQLYAFCEQYGVAYSRCGKLIVATSAEQVGQLLDLRRRAELNGVTDLVLLTAAEAQALEPELHCTAALLSPTTGIINSHELMLALLGDAERHGAMLLLNSPVLSATVLDNGIEIITGDAVAMRLQANIVVNAAGLEAPALVSRVVGFPQEHVPRAYLAKGNYFSLAGKVPFKRLVYPVPEPGGMGVHLTLDLEGQARFGPDVEWVRAVNYQVDPARSQTFYGAIRLYWPALRDGSLHPAYAGIRPKIVGPGEEDADFQIQGPAVHGVPGLVNLFGIESPGLTACLAIGDSVCKALHAGE